MITEPSVTPYLFFGGKCDAALAFYQEHLGAQVLMTMRYRESPDPPPPGMVPEGWDDKVMHAAFTVGKTHLMGSDGCDEKPGKNSHSLSLTMPDEGEARRAFEALADGGSVGMPIGRTFWSPCFGMVTDRFGIHWMVTVPEEAAAAFDSAAEPEDLDLRLEREIAAPREVLFRCWTEPELLKQWFCPKPWGVSGAELDVRAGGSSRITMRSPEGGEFPNLGIYLEVVPNEKIVFTDAYTSAWEPSAKPFMTGIITFEDLGGGNTKYTAVAKHWTRADRDRHEKMGFHEGWGRATDQLEELAATL